MNSLRALNFFKIYCQVCFSLINQFLDIASSRCLERLGCRAASSQKGWHIAIRTWLVRIVISDSLCHEWSIFIGVNVFFQTYFQATSSYSGYLGELQSLVALLSINIYSRTHPRGGFAIVKIKFGWNALWYTHIPLFHSKHLPLRLTWVPQSVKKWANHYTIWPQSESTNQIIGNMSYCGR
jgi:hypothetical protein